MKKLANDRNKRRLSRGTKIPDTQVARPESPGTFQSRTESSASESDTESSESSDSSSEEEYTPAKGITAFVCFTNYCVR